MLKLEQAKKFGKKKRRNEEEKVWVIFKSLIPVGPASELCLSSLFIEPEHTYYFPSWQAKGNGLQNQLYHP